eukprot:c12636_g1_i6.p1 GENE.c12636_g1_i6~~c12636_g1_i6.p1  ORF type:complete len:109 (-),score=29.97 c12636_g1_i6:113-439(-)
MNKDLPGFAVSELRVDGGVTKSQALMQTQADTLGFGVLRGNIEEVTSFGCAFAAGLAVGFWNSVDEIQGILESQGASRWHAAMADDLRAKLTRRWQLAVERSYGLNWD